MSTEVLRRSLPRPLGRTLREGWTWRWTTVVALCAWLTPATAEIYRYQDEYGGWHFTDAPPPGVDADPILDITESSKPSNPLPIIDLAAQLSGDHEPISPIARALLAVVAVKSAQGEATGFFCSEQGHILTNRHLVQSAEQEETGQSGEVPLGGAAESQVLQERLEVARRQLGVMEKDLAGYQRVLERANDADARQWAQDAYDRLSIQYREERVRMQTLGSELGELGMDIGGPPRDPGWGRRSAAVATSFDIVLEDGTELVADLMSVGKGHDLALLKIDGFRTPYLRLEGTASLAVGQRVFAIGNPLGTADSVTSGVITQITAEYLMTDAEIPPANSGGPLITESGDLIGINAVGHAPEGESSGAAGLGKSIPVHAARSEFRDQLPVERSKQLMAPAIEAYPPPSSPGGGFTWD